MAEYIEREAVLAEMESRIMWSLSDNALYAAAQEAPAADVAPVVHGRWVNILIAKVDTTGDCTECGKEAVWRTRNKPYDICPNCGADMRERKEKDNGNMV